MLKKAGRQRLTVIIAGFILAGMLVLGSNTVLAVAGDNGHIMASAPLLQSSKTVYYKASHSQGPDFYREGKIYNIVLKKNKIITYGSFKKSSSMNYGQGVYCKSKKRVFRLAKNVKYYSNGGKMGKVRISKGSMKSLCGSAPSGLGFFLKVRNGKVTEVIFSS